MSKKLFLTLAFSAATLFQQKNCLGMEQFKNQLEKTSIRFSNLADFINCYKEDRKKNKRFSVTHLDLNLWDNRKVL